MIHKIKAKVGIFFPALRNRNYRLYFFSQGISLIGTWLQRVAQQWLVYAVMTNSVIALGIMSAVSGLPIAVFSLFAGEIADRFDKRKIQLYAQIVMLILAVILGLLVQFKIVTLWEVIVLGLLLGVANAFDWPTRQAFWPEIINDKRDLASAISLFGAVFNAGQSIGPAVAAIAISSVGMANCFYLNAISFIPVIYCLHIIKTNPVKNNTNNHPVTKRIKAGFSYLKDHQEPLLLIILLSVYGVFIMSASTLAPVYTKEVFHGGAEIFGLITVATGVGATIGALIISYLCLKFNKAKMLVLFGLLQIIAIIIFAFSSNLPLTLVVLVICGLAASCFIALVNTLVQLIIPDELRGRVMSIYVLFWGGTMPLGSIYVTFLANSIGSAWSITSGAIISLIFLLLLIYRYKIISRLELLLANQ